MSNFTDFISSFKGVAVSGATQTMDLSQGNYFIGSKLTQDTTLAFSNVQQVSKWNYSAIVGTSGAYNISTASYDGISVNLQYGAEDFFFKDDGTAFYIVKTSPSFVFQYSLSTAWDLSTASITSSFSTESEDTFPKGLFFKPDGTKMYVVGDIGNNVYQYTLSTAWDISTASYDSVSFDVGSQDRWPNGVHFKPDGTIMYVVGTISDSAHQYSLSTAWDISTASYSNKSFDFTLQSRAPQNISFYSGGSKMYLLGSGEIHQYSLSTAWDISTATYDIVRNDTELEGTAQTGLFVKPDGTKMYVIAFNDDAVHQYDLTIPVSVTMPSSVEDIELEPLAKNKRITYEFSTFDGGANVQILNQKVTP